MNQEISPMQSQAPVHQGSPAEWPENQRWVRLPTRGRCPFTGFSRPFYYDLIKRGQIKSANLKQPGKLTGIRVCWLPSVLAWIERHIEKPLQQDEVQS